MGGNAETQRQWRAKNPERVRAYRERYKREGKTQKAKRKYYMKNYLRIRQKARDWQQDNPEAMRAYASKWYYANREALRLSRKMGIGVPRARELLREMDIRREEREKVRRVPRPVVHTDIL